MKRILLYVILSFMTTHIMSQENALSVISTQQDLDLSEIDLVAVPVHGPYMLAGNTMNSLIEDSEMPELVFPDSLIVDDILWTGKEFIVKSGYEIYRLDNIEEPLMGFDIVDYDIFPLDERRIYAVSHLGDTSHIFMLNLKLKRAKRMLTICEEIVNVLQINEATIVVTTQNIYLFDRDRCIRYLNFWTPVHTAVMTNKGLVFATDNEICLLTGVNQFLLLFETHTKKLLYDSKYLYIQLKEGDLLQCNLEMISSVK